MKVQELAGILARLIEAGHGGHEVVIGLDFDETRLPIGGPRLNERDWKITEVLEPEPNRHPDDDFIVFTAELRKN